MKRLLIIKYILGYLWAFAVIPAAAAGFVGMSYFEQKLIIEPGFHVSERWTGGAVNFVCRYDRYTVAVHNAVFRDTIFDKNKGIVQIDLNFDEEPPDIIGEEIDYDRDGVPDFNISFDTVYNTADLTPYSDNVVAIAEEGVMVYKDSRSVRVVLRK